MNNNTTVEKIVDYIETHIREDLSLDKIANELNYSKFYIARIFTKETKYTIYKYVQRRRLFSKFDYCTNAVFRITRPRKGYSVVYQ